MHAAAQGTQGLVEGFVPGLQADAALQVTDSLVQAAQLLQRLAAAEQRLHIPAVGFDGCAQGGLWQSPRPAPACPDGQLRAWSPPAPTDSTFSGISLCLSVILLWRDRTEKCRRTAGTSLTQPTP